jgi:hypothetical protein
VKRAAGCLVLVLATGACGAQSWSFDGDAAVATVEPADALDSDGRQDAEESDDESPPVEASAVDVAAPDAGPEASPTPDVSSTCTRAGDCPSDAPVCRTPPGECVRCGSDNDCAGAPAGPVCDTSTGRCVGCNSDGECPSSAPRCDPTAHACVRCLSNADCGRESSCDLATHLCKTMI